MRITALTSASFEDAALAFLETRRPYIAPKTYHEYRLSIKPLAKFFGALRLQDITADDIRKYQRDRMKECGPFAINHETSLLQQMLKRIGRWPEIASDFQPLPLPKGLRGRALRDEERARLLRIAGTNPNWQAAYLFATISVNTGMGPKEVSTLRLRDVDLELQTATVQPGGAKNVHRIRKVPLNSEALKAMRDAVKRAHKLGSVNPDDYVFPFRINRKLFDPMRYQTTFKTAWLKLVAAAGLQGFRLYDLRHHFATTSLEHGTPPEILEDIMGHLGRQMMKIYNHPRMEAKRKAVEMHCRQPEPKKKPARGVIPVTADQEELAKQLIALAGKLLKRNAR